MIASEIVKAAHELRHRVAKRAAIDARQSHGERVFSRGFELLSLDYMEERDENLIDYIDDLDLNVEVIVEAIESCRKAGSKFLAIGWGVDLAASQADMDSGNYEPMFDWDDLPSIALDD